MKVLLSLLKSRFSIGIYVVVSVGHYAYMLRAHIRSMKANAGSLRLRMQAPKCRGMPGRQGSSRTHASGILRARLKCGILVKPWHTWFGRRPGRQFLDLDRNGSCPLRIQRAGAPEIAAEP